MPMEHCHLRQFMETKYLLPRALVHTAELILAREDWQPSDVCADRSRIYLRDDNAQATPCKALPGHCRLSINASSFSNYSCTARTYNSNDPCICSRWRYGR